MADTYALKRIVSIILQGRLGYYRWLGDASRLVSIIGKIIAWSLPVGAPTLDMVLREVTVINQVLRGAILYQYQVVDVEIPRISTEHKLEDIQWELGCKLPSQGLPLTSLNRIGCQILHIITASPLILIGAGIPDRPNTSRPSPGSQIKDFGTKTHFFSKKK